MARQGINTGSAPDAGDGDSLLIGALKINANFSEIYTTLGDGNNITNSIGFASTSGISTYSNLSRVVIKDSGSTVGTAGTIDFGNNLTVSAISAGIVTVTATSSSDSQWQSTTAGIHTLSNVGIGTTNPTSALTVVGSGTSTSQLYVSGITTLAGITTVTGTTLFAKQLNVSGVSTFNNFIEANKSITVNGSNSEYLGYYLDRPNGGYCSWRYNYTYDTYEIVGFQAPLILNGKNYVRITSDTGVVEETLAQFNYNGSVDLYYNNSKKFETIGAGVTVTGTTFTNQLSVSGVSTFTRVEIPTATNVPLIENIQNKLIFGNDLTILSFSSNNYILADENPLSIGVVVEDGGPVNEAFFGLVNIFPSNDVYYGNDSYVTLGFGTEGAKLQTLGTGVTVTGTTFTNQLSVSGVSTFSSNTYFTDALVLDGQGASIFGSSKILLSGGQGGDTEIYSGGNSFSDFIFTAFQGGADRELARITGEGVLRLPYSGGGLNVTGISTFVGIATAKSTLFANQLSVSGVSTCTGSVRVGVDTSAGVILTSPNGTQYQLFVEDDGTLNTVAV